MKKRDLKYETIRVFSMLFILFLHEINTFMNRGSMLYYILATILLTGVPCFLMLSGKYAFNIDYNDKDYLKKYYTKKFVNLIIPVLVYMAIKEFHVMGYNLHKEITVYSYIRSLFVSIFNGYYYMEYWFLYVLIANILIAPFLGKFIINATKKEASTFLGIILIVNIISTFLGYFKLEFSLPYAFDGRNIFFYLGYFIDKFYNTKKEKRYIYIFGILSFVVSLLLLKYNKAVNIWSYSLTFTFISLSVYMFIRDFIKLDKIKGIILFLGKNSLAVYMLHMIFIYTFNDIIPKGQINQFLYALIIVVLSCVSSIVCGLLLDNTIIKWLKLLFKRIFELIDKFVINVSKRKGDTL